MATSDTLKALMKEDGPIDVRGSAPRARSNRFADRLLTLWRSVWRRRWSFMTTVWLVCVLGWGAITLWPTSFVASAVIYADLAGLGGLGGGAAGPAGTPAARLKAMLMSEDGLAAVRENAPLDPAALRSLPNDVGLRSSVPPVFVLAYEHHDPEVAHQVVRSVIAGFETRLDQAAATSLEEAEALEASIDEQRRLLQTAEAELVAFRRDNADYVGGADERAAELASLEEETAQLENQVTTAIADRDAIAAELAKVRDPDGGAAPAKSPDEIATERRTLEAELVKLQERYADTHPYVIAVVDALDTLDADALAAGAQTSSLDGEEPALDREELEQRHGELIVKVSTLSALLGETRREFERLQALTQTAGSAESDLAQLEAGRDALQSELADLQRRQSQLSAREGGETGQKPFRLIRPPELPDDPIGPSRLMALAAVLVAGGGAGALVAVICNRFKGVYESAWQLRKRFDVGVLGTLTEVMSPSDRRRLGRERLAFGAASIALIGAFGGLSIAELTDSLAPLGEHLRTQFLG